VCIIIPLLIGVGILDWQHRRIPNLAVLLIAGLAWGSYFLWKPFDATTVMINILLAVLLTVPGYLRGIVGAGDVKLMLAIAPLWSSISLLQIFASGVLLTVCLLKLQAPLVASWRGVFAPSSHTDAKPVPPSHTGLPLGTAIALGATLYLLTGEYLLGLVDVTH
jgi:prepilin peptidase CpaA